MNILKDKGVTSYIMPNKWLQAGYGKNLREYFLTKQLINLVDFGDIQIFQGATTYPCIFIAKNNKPESIFSVSVLKSTNAFDFETIVMNSSEKFETSDFSGDTWVISSKKEQQFLDKLNKSCTVLSDFIGGQAYRGVLTGLTDAFLINDSTKNEIVSGDYMSKEKIRPFLQGRDLTKYNTVIPTNHLLLFEKGTTRKNSTDNSNIDFWLQEKYPSIAKWLAPFEERGKKRTDKGEYWWELRACDYYEKFSKPKIMYQAFQVKPCFIYDEQGLYCNNSVWFIPTDNRALLGLLNSKMGWWLITKFCTQIQNGCQLIWKYFGQIPIPKLDSPELTQNVDKMIELTKSKETLSNSFIKYLNAQYSIEKLSRKMESWDDLDFADFIKELNKAIKKAGGQKLSKMDEMDWMEVFESKKAEAQNLKAEIDKTDREVDTIVYELYGLTKEEIEIVEGNV